MKDFLENKLKMNLQFFAEPPAGDTPPGNEENPGDTPPADDKPNLKYSDEDVNKIVKQKLARAEKEKAEAIEEAKKLAAMNEEERKEHEFEALQKELADLKKKDAYYGLSKEASKMLSEHNINANDDLLAFVVKDDAETTKQAVDAFVAMFNEQVQEGVKQALAGKSPKVNVNPGQAVTKEKINSIKDPVERLRAIQNNPQLYK